MLPLVLATITFTFGSTMHPTHLRTEYLDNPIGIGETVPRLSWWCESDRRGDMQSAYQVIVASSPALLDQNQGDLWDSGIQKTDRSIQVEYAGSTLHSRQQAFWKVRLWDKDGAAGSFSPAAHFEIGLLEPSDWQAKWIGMPNQPEASADHPVAPGPAPYLRREFTITKPVARARVYSSAHGVYKLFLDGKRVSDHVLDPGFTDYKKRIQYQSFDVTSALKPGRHGIGMVVGDGWYVGKVGWGGRNNYGKQPLGLAQLEISYADGTRDVIATGPDWKVSSGPILTSDLLDGEQYDARKEMREWSNASFNDSTWVNAYAEDLGAVPVEAANSQPVKVWKELRPVSVKAIDNATIFDLGQNMVGWARLKVRGNAGEKVTMRFAEMLNPDGTIYTTNLRKARCTDEYTLRGGHEEVYEPSFTFHGFRYVELTGYPGTPTADAITGIVVGSDTPNAGSFECSNALVNKLQHNIYWGQRGNYLSIPTDCPQRDERLGWMGDAEVFIKTATYNCDVSAFMTKWLNDVQDGQSPEGGFADVSPRIYVGNGAPAWGDAGVIVPWSVYETYDDRRILERHFDSMKKWVDYIHKSNDNLLWLHHRNNDYGDWLNIKEETEKDLLATAFFAHSCDLVARSARVLGRASDAEKYGKLFEGIRTAFLTAYVKEDGSVKGDTQTGYLLALGFDLVPSSLRPALVRHLVSNIEAKGNHLSTGFLGVKLLNNVLSSAGHDDLAYKLLLQESFPSWGYSIRQGATTIWERWDGWTRDKGFQDPGMNSFNHYSLGSVGEWMYSTVGGIRMISPGYKKFAIHPVPGKGVTWAKCSYDSMYGRIACSWQESQMDVEVPANTTAYVYVSGDARTVRVDGRPAGEVPDARFVRDDDGYAVFEVGAGRYRFTG